MLAEALQDAYTHRELSDLFAQCAISEQGGTPKWERALLALKHRQLADGCGDNVGAFLQAVLDPPRFVDRLDEFSELRGRVNTVLAFSGLAVGSDGRLCAVPRARTLPEAQERAGRLRHALTSRQVHPDVLAFCRPELLSENYFHAVLEATKGAEGEGRGGPRGPRGTD